MPKPIRLGIPCNRHSSDHSLRRQREKLEAHLVVQGTMELGVFGWQIWPVIGRSHSLRVVTLSQPRSDIGSPSSGFFVAFDGPLSEAE